MNLMMLGAFLRHPIRFTRSFIVGVRFARQYEKAVGKKLKDM